MLKNYCTSSIYSMVIFFLFTIATRAQKIQAATGSYGIDHMHKIIVWQIDTTFASALKNKNIKIIQFNEDFELNGSLTELQNNYKVSVSNRKGDYVLYSTRLPIINISVEQPINNATKVPACLTYHNNENYIKSVFGIEYRGNFSLSFPKKTYDLEFWTDSISKASLDVKFSGLRNDDDWIIDGLYNEPLRLRSFVASKLWTKIHKPYYKALEPKAKSGIGAKFVEVFKNDSYLGLHALTEAVDRKLLKLKVYKGTTVFGELFKASSYEGAPSFVKAPKYNNIFPHWGGFEMRYPVIDYTSHWNNVYTLVDAVANGSDAVFAKAFEQQLNVDNVIDYFLFVNLLRATDNLGKNYYLGKYDKGEPYFFVPWDLDGVLGIIQDGKKIATTNDILSNNLFDRLLKLNPNGYKNKLKQKWELLRKTAFSTKVLTAEIDTHYNRLKQEKIYEREQILWNNATNDAENYDYLKQWLLDRLSFLDGYFNAL